MVFSDINTCRISAKFSTEEKVLNVDGVSTAATTPENAAEQINKLIGIVNWNVKASGMKRIVTQEAIES